MWRSFIIAMVVAVGVVLAGCGKRTPDETRKVRAKAAEATTEQTESRESSSKPPNGTLTFEQQRKIGKLGGYCWDGVCTEATLVVPPEDHVLTFPKGAELLFEYGGEGSPSSVEVRLYPLFRGKVETAGKPLRLPHAGVQQIRIPVEVDPGEYAIELFVRVPKGSAFYYFRAVVDKVTLPESGGPGGRSPDKG